MNGLLSKEIRCRCVSSDLAAYVEYVNTWLNQLFLAAVIVYTFNDL
ncbi:hypothetical protein VCR1J2_450095 [Vibrio coralliirubri]|nr:hypothetical protein VCR1J2_450095 [Vibrio coralliirubri]